MLSIFESAALEIPHGGVIKINLSTKPLSNDEKEKTIHNLEICDFQAHLVCIIEFISQTHNTDKVKLEDLNLEKVLMLEQKNDKQLSLGLLASKYICKGLYGSLTETECGNRITYEAKFIAD